MGGEPVRVLYVEDDAGDRELTRRHLERHAPHLRLAEVDTVGAALERLAARDVDLVLSDFRLPDGTGLDLLEAVKARAFNVPVVLVTGSGDVHAAVRLLKAGAADYVVKRPGYLETLPAVLEAALRWFRSAAEVRQRPIRVLYAEHDPTDVELTRRTFRHHGPHFHLDVVTRGSQVLPRLRTAPYDVLLLDYRLPDLTGIEVLKELRAEEIRIPAVMVTGQGDEDTAVEAFKLGAADYVVKHEGYVTKLPSTLENALIQRRLADEKDALLVLNGLSRSIAALQDRDELARLVSRAAADLLKADLSILWLAEGGELRPLAGVGFEGPVEPQLRCRVDPACRDRMLAQRRVDLAALLEPEALAVAGLGPAAGTLAVSLVWGRRLIGVLGLASRHPREFDGTEERLLTLLADHAAIAIERARLYQELRDRLAELQQTQARLLQTEKVAAMGQLLAGVAHELNNPLSVLVGHTTLLRAAVGAGPLAQRAEKIGQAAERCARIVKNFLALARQRPPERRHIDLNGVVQEAVELLGYPLRLDNVEVDLSLEGDLPRLWADGHQLHQVVVNLITNAHHALRSAPAPRRIVLSTRYDPERALVRLDVADNGPGVPPAIQGRIFEPFFTTKPPGQGTGLGLSLCRGIIEAHGGRLDLENAPQGALFRIELPLATPREAEREARESRPRPGGRGKSILVVEDEPEVAEVLVDLLTAEGLRVETVADGALALDRALTRSYDLILSDIRMPGLDGPGLYRELERRRPDLCRRLIFMTGDQLSPETREFLERTAVRTLGKPFEFDEVRGAIQRGLEAR